MHTGRSLLETYLGADPARRVLDGAIVRGKAEPVEAVLWYSDLQGFTRIGSGPLKGHGYTVGLRPA